MSQMEFEHFFMVSFALFGKFILTSDQFDINFGGLWNGNHKLFPGISNNFGSRQVSYFSQIHLIIYKNVSTFSTTILR